LDVFTSRRLAGNQLAVVHHADGVPDDTMAAFARETRLSETTFVQAASERAADYRTRIFMPLGEIPFAGHPSLGTAVAVALARGNTEISYVQQTDAGLQPIEVEAGGDVAHASMLQEPPEFGPELDPAEIFPMAGLAPADADPELPAQAVATGVPQIIVPVRREALDRVAPSAYAALRELLVDRFGALVMYLAACDPGSGTARARALFPDQAVVQEDPATGSAAGPLLAYLRQRAGIDRLVVEQGVEMGRPSRLECTWEGDRPRVGGDVVVVATGTVTL
jgi:trans-2,3-dihydro-3-hydroxyanthranilate isomerase